VVLCSKGMGPVTGWLDLLPEMLRRVLGTARISDPVSFLRNRAPREWRERAASLLPDGIARDVAASLSSPRADWSRTRAFALPSDSAGLIRINLRGRERFGIVPADEEAALCEQIAEGLRTFTDLDGEPSIDRIVRSREILGEGERLEAFPDLVVLWAPKTTLRGGGVRSPRFGEILRNGGPSTGRSGNHTEGAWVAALPGRGSAARTDRKIEPYDIPVTVLAALGLPHGDLPGQPLLPQL
jgi:predicted AlkP superfamily phosphohydrolase/phosphomutase